MSELFGVDIAGIINDAFAGNLHALTLHKKSSSGVDAYGVPVTSEATHNGEGVRLSWDSKTATARGYPMDAAKILVLQNGVSEPAIGDAITIDSEKWRLIDVRKDPVNATWICAGVLE